MAFLFLTVNQIRLGNVFLLDTYLLSRIWLCRCENDGVLWLLTLEMWFLALLCFTMALLQHFNQCFNVKTQQHCTGAWWNMILHQHSVVDFSDASTQFVRGHCKECLSMKLRGSSHSVCTSKQFWRNSTQTLFQCLSLWCPLFSFSLQLHAASHIHSFLLSSS